MTINKNSLLKACLVSLFFTCILGLYYFFFFHMRNDVNFLVLFLVILFLMFFGSAYWFYYRIEYDRMKWKGEQRPWYSWMWWPSRKWGEAYYWNSLSRVTIILPFLLFFWVVFIFGYPLEIGVLLAVLSFLLLIFVITELHHWWEQRKQLVPTEDLQHPRYHASIIVVLFLVFILMVVALPFIEEPRGNYQNYMTEQQYIGTWENTNITLTISQDHTCSATYNNTTYSGHWTLYTLFYYIKISWDQQLFVPHPNNKSLLFPIEEVYLINGGKSLSLYTLFSSPDYLTLEKVSK